MLAAFERDAVAAAAADVFVGAAAEVERGLVGRRAARALREAGGVDVEPALHHDGRADVQRELALFIRTGEGLQRAGVVARADHGKGLALALEGMQVEQHFVARDQRRQHVGHAGFVVGRCLGRAEQAVEVALALALQSAPCERIGDGHQGQLAALQLQGAGLELAQDALDAQGAGDFVAMHAAHHEQPGTGVQRGEGVDAQAVGGNAGKWI